MGTTKPNDTATGKISPAQAARQKINELEKQEELEPELPLRGGASSSYCDEDRDELALVNRSTKYVYGPDWDRVE